MIASSSAVLLFLILLASFSPAVAVSFHRRRGLILPIQVIYLNAFPFAACSEGSYMSSNKTSNKNCNFFPKCLGEVSKRIIMLSSTHPDTDAIHGSSLVISKPSAEIGLQESCVR